MLPKFFYTPTYKSQVLQQFLGFIILKTVIKFVQYDLSIFVGFVHSGILLLWSIWWNLKSMGSVRRRLWRMNMRRRTLSRRLFSWLILKRRGSVRRFQRMNMWRRTLLRSLCSWLILRGGVV
jgi:hypothetical protein